jgi:hypothetical protein
MKETSLKYSPPLPFTESIYCPGHIPGGHFLGNNVIALQPQTAAITKFPGLPLSGSNQSRQTPGNTSSTGRGDTAARRAGKKLPEASPKKETGSKAAPSQRKGTGRKRVGGSHSPRPVIKQEGKQTTKSRKAS